MDTFWDTSALVALLLREPHTAAAQAAWRKTARAWAWRWAALEAESALLRRKAPPEAWEAWARLCGALRLVELDDPQLDALRAFNRALGLRAADAAHLFVCQRAAEAIPGLRLVCHDAEMTRAARRIGLRVEA